MKWHRLIPVACLSLSMAACSTPPPLTQLPPAPEITPSDDSSGEPLIVIAPVLDPARLSKFEAVYASLHAAAEIGLATGMIRGAAADRVRLAMPEIDGMVATARTALILGDAASYLAALGAIEHAIVTLRAASAVTP